MSYLNKGEDKICGIVGVFGIVSAQHEKAFKELLVVDQLRGEHSTGMAIVSRGNAYPSVVKAIGGPENLSAMKAYDKAFGGLQRACIGHNRFATSGGISNSTAHPFTMEHITGVHNGTLRQYNELDGYGDFTVDSQVLYNHIAQNSLADAVSKAAGAMALMYWDRREEELVIYRNSERPLYMVYTDDGKAVFIASEAWMVQGVLERNKIKHILPMEVPENHSMTFNLPANNYSELAKPHLRKLEQKATSNFTYTGFGNTSAYGGYYGGQNSVSSESKNSPAVSANASSVSGDSSTTPPSNTVLKIEDKYPLIRESDMILSMEGYEIIRGKSWAVFSCDQHTGEVFVLDPAITSKLNLLEGSMIMGSCNGLILDKNGEHFYLLRKESVQEIEFATQPTYLGPDGKENTLTEWEKKYGTCANCTGDVDVATHRFDANGNVFCVECHSNPVLADVIKV